MSYKLSICIPTYNRARFIPDAIDSILSQATDEVEIVVSDNASTDNTQDIIVEYQKSNKNLKYFRHSENVGPDKNFQKLIELSKGEYCIILGSDDWFENGAITNLLKVLRDISIEKQVTGMTYVFNHYTIEKEKIYTPPHSGQITKLISKEIIYEYQYIGYRFGYISAHVFNREKALYVLKNCKIYDNFYSIHHLLSHMVNIYEEWYFYDYPIVAWRTGNDSFAAQGLYKRFLIDLLGYEEIVSQVFGKKSIIYKRFMNNQLTACTRDYVLRAKQCEFDERLKIYISAFKKLSGYPNFWISVLPIYFVPRRWLPYVKKIYKKIKK